MAQEAHGMDLSALRPRQNPSTASHSRRVRRNCVRRELQYARLTNAAEEWECRLPACLPDEMRWLPASVLKPRRGHHPPRCSQEGLAHDQGEFTFLGPEAYRSKMTMTSTRQRLLIRCGRYSAALSNRHLPAVSIGNVLKAAPTKGFRACPLKTMLFPAIRAVRNA